MSITINKINSSYKNIHPFPNNQKENRTSNNEYSQKNTNLNLMPCHNIAFQGNLKKNLHMGEAILKEFLADCPPYNSNSFYQVRIEKHRDNERYSEILPKIQQIANKYGNQIETLRLTLKGTYGSLEEYISHLENAISKTHAANCGECSDLVQWKFLNKGIKANKVNMTLYKNNSNKPKYYGDHTFVVLGLKKGARLENPSTWGSEAVVVDGWRKIVLPTHDALNIYMNELGYNKSEYYIKYSSSDLINVDNYLNN